MGLWELAFEKGRDLPAYEHMTTIAIIGGTGEEGCGLGLRLAMAGHRVVIGSRRLDRSSRAAEGILQLRPGLAVSGTLNADAAREAEWVVLAVPYQALTSTVQPLVPFLSDKLVISVIIPLSVDGGHPRAVAVPQGSAAQQVAALLPDSHVVAAFHHISARDLCVPDRRLEADIIVCGDHSDAKKQVMDLAEQLGSFRGIDGGPLENARYVEELVALLMRINLTYKVRTMVRLVGI